MLWKKNFSEKTFLKILLFPRSPFFIRTDMAIVSCCVVTHLQWPEVKHVNNQGQESGAVGGGRWLDFWVLYWRPRILDHTLAPFSCFSAFSFFSGSSGEWCWYCFYVDAIFNMSWGELNQQGGWGDSGFFGGLGRPPINHWEAQAHFGNTNLVTTGHPLKWRNLCELNLPLTSYFHPHSSNQSFVCWPF